MESGFKTEDDFKIAVIGLGIIGGSMAYALRGFRGARIVGCDMNDATRAAAIESGAVCEAYPDAASAIDGADLVVIATYPESIAGIVRDNAGKFKKGAVITDVCGVKTSISAQIAKALPDGVDYVGGHPMAGKEVDGFKNASPEMFWACGFIITPIPASKPQSVQLVREMVSYIGATRIDISSPEMHDSVIAYTSDMMHISAAALCLDYNPNMNRAYTAGAFRDCTRIALINPELWTELFLANSDNILKEIDRFSKSLEKIRTAISDGNADELRKILSVVRQNKQNMQNREPQG